MKKYAGSICGDGMCPWLPCKDSPNCNHLKEFLEDCKNGN